MWKCMDSATLGCCCSVKVETLPTGCSARRLGLGLPCVHPQLYTQKRLVGACSCPHTFGGRKAARVRGLGLR